MKTLLTFLVAITVVWSYAQQKGDYMVDLYDKLHDSPLQQKFKELRPMPAGVVYIQHPGEGEKEIRAHFRLMKELGFNALKQIQTVPGWTVEQISLIALEEGIIPWWYGQGGWERITPELLKKLGIPENTPVREAREMPAMVTYQTNLLKDRIQKTIGFRKANEGQEMKFLSGGCQAYDPVVGGRGVELNPEGERLFLEWCKNTYRTIDNLNEAWNSHHIGLEPPGGEFRSWDDFKVRWKTVPHREFRNYFDILKFKVDNSLSTIARTAERFSEFYGDAPFRAGGELGLFRPQASFCVDLESIANTMTRYGSFYPSIHFVWHFNEVNGELARPFYMQASLAADYFKGGWAGPWEATGGPQQLSGEKNLNTGFTVDEGVMTQFILSQIAGGFKGFGLWCWSVRSAGLEAGEYSLLDRNNQPGPRAVKVGAIARAMNKYRDEIWEAHKEPMVGVLTDWNNEALMTVLSLKSRPDYAQDPYNCRIGVSRALINANIPFEYVTARDLRAGLAPRYKIIYLPGNLFLTNDLLPILREYVNQGGRLVMDMPGAIMDEYSRVFPTGKGSDFEQLFGTTINDFQFSGFNVTNSLDKLVLKGFTVYATPTSARVLAKYDNGNPAVMENNSGKGTAVLMGYEASKMCFTPGNKTAEAMLLKFAIGDLKPSYLCRDAIVYRLASPGADHYFLINDGESGITSLIFLNHHYGKITDALSGEPVNPLKIDLDANSGRWIRCEK